MLLYFSSKFFNRNLEITDISKASGFAFLDLAQNLSKTKWVAIGLRTDNLDSAVKILQKNGVNTTEYYTSLSTRYPKGYKHKSAALNLCWFDKAIYVSEYDPLFFEERELGTTQNLSKKLLFSIEQSQLAIERCPQIPPPFLQIKNEIPEIRVQLNTKEKFPFIESLQLGWMNLRWIG